MLCIFQWLLSKSQAPLPGHLRGQPCVNDGYLYWCCERYGVLRSKHLALYRIPLSRSRSHTEPWQCTGLPPGTWTPNAYFFSHSNHLYGILTMGGLSAVYQVFRQQHSSGGWDLVASFPRRVFNFAVALVDSQLIIIGGTSSIDTSSAGVRSVQAMDLLDSSAEWLALPDLPYDCSLPSVVVHKSYVHILGSTARGSPEDRNVMSLDCRVAQHDRRWQFDILPPVPHRGCSAAVINDYIVVVGGVDDNNSDVRNAYVYVPECSKFLAIPSLHQASSLARCFAHLNSLYVMAMSDVCSPSRYLEIQTLSDTASHSQWEAMLEHPVFVAIFFFTTVCSALIAMKYVPEWDR